MDDPQAHPLADDEGVWSVDDRQAYRLADDELADEIELYGDLVVAASEAEGDLTQPQIDRLLGVELD